MPLTVVVADDALIVREGVRRILDSAPDLQVVAECADLDELLAAVGSNPPDVVVTDIRMPPTGTDEGIRAAASLRVTHPGVGVVVLSQYSEPDYALSLLEGGSEGRAYLLKERISDPDQLLRAVREVAAGGSVIDPLVVETLVAARTRSRDDRLAALTPRELEVLSEIAQGKSNQGVAQALYLSERAVEKHINALFAKLGLTEAPAVNRRVAAVLVYLSAADGGAASGPSGPTSAGASTPDRGGAASLVRGRPTGHAWRVAAVEARPVDVLIVDDQEAFRAAARSVVGVSRGFTVVAEAATGEEAVQIALDRHPDLVLMDINLPGIDGLRATRAIVDGWPDARVLLMSTYRSEDLPADAATCGAAAYVHKEDLSPAILRGVLDGTYRGGFAGRT